MNDVLNPSLYNALVRAYGDVRVHNAGETVTVLRVPMETTICRSDRPLGPGDVSGGEQYAVCCPFCGDRRFRLYISHAAGGRLVVNDTEYSVSRSLCCCFNEDCLKDAGNRRRFQDSLDGAWTPSPAEPPLVVSPVTEDAARIERESRRMTLPVGEPLDGPEVPEHVLRYIESRGFTAAELAAKGMLCAKVQMYSSPAIVIPVWQQGKLDFWQARAVVPEQGKPKYYMPPGSRKSWALYNMDAASRSKLVVLTEGVFDALKVPGDCGVAMFGKKPSDIQLRLLHGLWGRGALVWLPDMNDPDALPIAEQKVEEWNIRGVFAGGAHVVRLPGEDPGYWRKEDLAKWIQEQTGLSPSPRAGSR